MTGPAQVLETHISVVLLFGDQAVKIKKPVRFPFIDLSTPELRKLACRREVELNRRLAPDVYLGVADIIGPDGITCDHVVVMRRMPGERRLSTLAREGNVHNTDVFALARLLTAFHAGAETSATIAAAATRDAVRDRWEAGFAEIQPLVGTALDLDVETEIEDLARTYLDGRASLFDSRIERGRVVDGHGDLLAGDIFMLDDGPRVLDCLEFDDSLRYGDVLADIAFLAMDLERLGAAELARRFLAAYREFSGETHPASLEHHYIAFRAHIRAKVALLRGSSEGHEEAQTLLRIALTHLRHARVRLTLVGGGPGSGKSTLARGISDRTGWAVVRSDEVRKDLVGVGHEQHLTSAIGEGIYSEATNRATYAAMLDRTRLLLERGESVILDATWRDADARRAAAELAEGTSSQLVEIRCDAPIAVRQERVGQRARRGGDASDATTEITRGLEGRADPWPAATVVETTQSIDASIATGLRIVGVR
jgi:aminoglycoside phosphotransferase family enzyme/predicted kinase